MLYGTWTVMTLASLVFLKPKTRLTLMRHMQHMTVVEYLAKENENK